MSAIDLKRTRTFALFLAACAGACSDYGIPRQDASLSAPTEGARDTDAQSERPGSSAVENRLSEPVSARDSANRHPKITPRPVASEQNSQVALEEPPANAARRALGFDAEAVKAKLERIFGGEWRVGTPGGWVFGKGPRSGTPSFFGLTILPFSYNDPRGREAAREAIYGSNATFMVIGASDTCTVLMIADEDDPYIPKVREALGLVPVNGPTTLQEFERERRKDKERQK